MIESAALTRRRLLTGCLGAGAALGLAGCAIGSNPTAADPAPSGSTAGFAYTDARGEVIDLPAIPRTVVAQASVAASLWDWGHRVTGVYGDLGPLRGKPNYQLGRIDLATMTVIADSFGQFDVETFAALQPDLLIDMSFDNTTLWYVPEAVADRIEPLAPSIGVETLGKDLEQILATFEDLAVRLGTDVAAPAVVEAKERFAAAQQRITDLTASGSGLRVAVLADGGDGSAYVVNTAMFADLQFLATHGVDFLPYDGDPEQHFQQVSYEQIGRHADADLIFVDARMGPDTLVGQPTVAALGAVRAEQVYDWFPAAPYSHAGYAQILAGYADALENARPV